MPGENQNENQNYTFRFKLVYTEITSSITVHVPVISLFTWSQFMDSTEGARWQIINYSHLHYDLVVSGQPNGERAPAISDNLPPLIQGLSHHNHHNNNFSFYIRPKNIAFLNYLIENCPNSNLTDSLSISNEYEMFLNRTQEGAQADSEDDLPEPSIEPTPEPTCENMDVVTNELPTFYQGTCCICYEVRNLSDHWQCYIPDGANRHGICDQCFQTYRSSSSRARDCPVCRQPLGDTNYGEVAPPTPPTPTVHSHTISPPEPEPAPTVLQDFPSGGSGAAGPPDLEDAATPGPPNNHYEFLNNYNHFTLNDLSFNNINTNAVYDYINNVDNIPRIEVRNQEIIIRNIPYNEMVDLQRHNPNNNVTSVSNNTLRDSLLNVISTQINNISNNNRLTTNIFNSTFYNVDNNNNHV